MKLKHIRSFEITIEPGTDIYFAKFLDSKGVLHNTEGPACICEDGTKSWWHHGDFRKNNKG